MAPPAAGRRKAQISIVLADCLASTDLNVWM